MKWKRKNNYSRRRSWINEDGNEEGQETYRQSSPTQKRKENESRDKIDVFLDSITKQWVTFVYRIIARLSYSKQHNFCWQIFVTCAIDSIKQCYQHITIIITQVVKLLQINCPHWFIHTIIRKKKDVWLKLKFKFVVIFWLWETTFCLYFLECS